MVTVGTELLLGHTLDTNTAHIGRVLADHGIRLSGHTTVADVAADISRAIDQALTRTGCVIVTGGLGPTRDDITREVVATLLGAPLQFDQNVWDGLVDRWARLGRTLSESNRSQAMVPTGATVLPNRRGTAPGLWIETTRGVVVLLPGVPIELVALLKEEVLPRLTGRFGTRKTRSRFFRTAGVPESRLGELLGPHEAAMEPVSLAYLPDQGGVDLRLTAWELGEAEIEAALDRAEAILMAQVGESVFTRGREDLAAVVLAQLRSRGLTLATAESCTGGMIGSRITSIPGSSDVYLGGVVSYANAAKRDLLDVPDALITTHGAVSEEVARAMAEGAARHLGAEAALSVTGIAGPGGGSAEKPVGTVAFAWYLDGEVTSRTSVLFGDREQIRLRATQAALLGMLSILK